MNSGEFAEENVMKKHGSMRLVFGVVVGTVLLSSQMLRADITAISDLRMWLKADALSLSDGDPVESWLGSYQVGGVYRSGMQTTASAKPTYVAGGINGVPTVRFDGSNDIMRIVYDANWGDQNRWNHLLGDLGENGVTVFTVSSVSVAGNGASMGDDNGVLAFMVSPNVSATPVCELYRHGTALDASIGGYTRQAVLSTFVLSNAAASQSAVGTVRVRDADGLYVTASNSWGNSSLTLAVFPYLGARYPGDNTYFEGDISEVIVYARDLNTTEIAQVESYLMGKYGFPDTNIAGVNGFRMWLKADSVLGYDGDPVTSWWGSLELADGYRRGVMQTDDLKKPVLVADGIGGLPAVRFDGSDDIMRVVYNANFGDHLRWDDHVLGSSGSDGVTVFSVSSVSSGLNGVLMGDDNGVFDFSVSARSGGPAARVYRHNASLAVPLSGLASDAVLCRFVLSNAAANQGNTVDIVAVDRAGQGASGSSSWTNSGLTLHYLTYFGARLPGDNTRFQGDVSEFLVFNRALDAPEIAQVETFLKDKYGFSEPPRGTLILVQ